MESTTSPTQVATRIAAALRDRNLDLVRDLDHPDVVRDFVAIRVFRGVDACQRFFAELLAAFPDFDIAITQLIADGDRVVTQWLATGTFAGSPFQGIHATGRSVELRGCDVMRVEQGRLRHNTVYYDGLDFARQIGLLPTQGSAPDKALTAAFNASTDVRTRIRSRAKSSAR